MKKRLKKFKWYGVRTLIVRKIVSAITASAIMLIIYSAFEEIAVSLFLGMYLLPIVLIYGTTSSIFSDLFTKRLRGFYRMFMAFIIHVFMGAILVLFPMQLWNHEGYILILDADSLLNNFFFISAVLSAFIFWFIDELIRSDKCKKIQLKFRGVLNKISDLRI